MTPHIQLYEVKIKYVPVLTLPSHHRNTHKMFALIRDDGYACFADRSHNLVVIICIHFVNENEVRRNIVGTLSLSVYFGEISSRSFIAERQNH